MILYTLGSKLIGMSRAKLLYLFTLLLIAANSYAQSTLEQLLHIPNPNGMQISDVYGYADEQGEYAVISYHSALAVHAIDQPSAPALLFYEDSFESIYRDSKVHNNFLYSVNEAGGGLSIFDLTNLDSGPISWAGNDSLETAHNLFIDDNHLYICGSNLDVGVLMYDLAEPQNPAYVGRWSDFYVDDLLVHQNLLFAALIFEGKMAVVDISDKANPNIIALESTPGGTTHSVAKSATSNIVFASDESPDGPISAFDISNPTEEVERLGSIRLGNTLLSIPNKLGTWGDFLLIAHYTDGLIVADVTDPSTVIQVANFDSSPLEGNGQLGCWGLYTNLPSGNILIGDLDEGLFLLCPNFNKAARISGMVTDTSGTPLSQASITLQDGTNLGSSTLFGTFTRGIPQAGLYDITVSKAGYCTKILSNVCLLEGQVIDLNVVLQPDTVCQEETEDLNQTNCTEFIPAAICESVSNNAIAEQQQRIIEPYQNPIEDQLRLASKLDTQLHYALFNLEGKQLLSGEFHRQILLSTIDFPAGVYLLKVTSANASTCQKILKN